MHQFLAEAEWDRSSTFDAESLTQIENPVERIETGLGALVNDVEELGRIYRETTVSDNIMFDFILELCGNRRESLHITPYEYEKVFIPKIHEILRDVELSSREGKFSKAYLQAWTNLEEFFYGLHPNPNMRRNN